MAIEKVKKHMILSRKFLSFGGFSKIKSNIPLQTAQDWENKYPRKIPYRSGK
jgi:hypothetical protein